MLLVVFFIVESVSHLRSRDNAQLAELCHVTRGSQLPCWLIDLKFVSLQVHEVRSNLSQIGFDVEMIQQMVTGLVSQLQFSFCSGMETCQISIYADLFTVN